MRPDQLARPADQLLIAVERRQPVGGAIGAGELGRLEAELHVPVGVVAGSVAELLVACRPAGQLIDRQLQQLALEVPQRQIHRADGVGGEARGRIGRRDAHHHVEQLFGGERILVDEQWAEMIVDQRHRGLAVAGGAEAPRAVVRRHQAPDLREMVVPARAQPLVARIARHRVGDLGVLGPWRPARDGLVLLGVIGAPRDRVGDGEGLDALDLHERSSRNPRSWRGRLV